MQNCSSENTPSHFEVIFSIEALLKAKDIDMKRSESYGIYSSFEFSEKI